MAKSNVDPSLMRSRIESAVISILISAVFFTVYFHNGQESSSKHLYLRVDTPNSSTDLLLPPVASTDAAFPNGQMQRRLETAIHACVNNKSGEMKFVQSIDDCNKPQHTVYTWNTEGIQGKPPSIILPF